MAKRTKSIKTLIFIILLFNIFIFISSKPINYDNESERTKVENNPSLSNDYTITFKSSIPNYLKVTVTPKEGIETPSLCYSPTDPNCETGRIVMANRADKKPIVAFIKKSEIKNNQFYILVTCQTTTQAYTLKVEGGDKCKIEDGAVYTYIVSEANKVMEFELSGISDEYTILNLGLEGSKTARIRIDESSIDQTVNIQQVVFTKSSFVTFPIGKNINDTSVLVTFSISDGKPGEFLRLNAYTYKHGEEDVNAVTADNLLYPGGPTIMGLVYRHGLYYEEICFPVSAMANEFHDTSRFYLSGIIYSKYADFWMADENEDYMGDTEVEITDGILSVAIEPKGKKRSICLEFYGSYYEQTIKQSEVAFSLTLVPAPIKKSGDFYQLNPPQIIGLAYPYMIPKDKSLAFSGATIEAGRYSFFLYNRKGLTKMFVTDCTSYPNCNYNMEEDAINMIEVVASGKFIFYDSKTEDRIEALDKNKKIVVVQCIDDGNDEKGYCEFDLSVFNNNQEITLVQGQNLAQYIEKDKTGSYKIFYKGAVELLSVAVEIMIHSGEAIFNGDFSPDQFSDTLKDNLGQYQSVTTSILSNKVFIYFDLKRYAYDSLYIKYKAIKDTFFTIKYHEWRADAKDEFLDEIIFPSESYLLAINPASSEKYTVAKVENNRYKTKRHFMTNFFALNCDFKVTTERTKGVTEITFADGYAQDIIGDDEGSYYSKEYYNYKVSIEQEDKSKYEKKMCMIYVAGFHTSDLFTDDSILIGSNVNQQIILDKDKFRTINFLYQHTDYQRALVVYANIIDKAFYYIQIAIRNQYNVYKRQVITRSFPFYISKKDLEDNCKNKDSFCSIIITMEYVADTPGMSRTNPMIEITVREALPKGEIESESLRVPGYIQKNIAKIDFTTGDGYYYLYTDIGQGDEGEITVNFLRDFGEVYGRIVPKDKKIDNKDIEWMDTYRLPSADYEDGVKFNGYLKKYLFNSQDTEDCQTGCYLILGIRISQIGEWAEDWKFYPFSIITLIGPAAASANDASVVTIQVGEFIIGNVDISSNIKLKQFYQIWLSRDSDRIHIDWQSELAGLYINIGGEKPVTTTNADFTFLPNGKDGIFILTKDQIKAKAKEKTIDLPYADSLEDVHLIIGVWTDKTDSADTELYSLRIRQVGFNEEDTEYEVDVIEVNTDQKIMCKPVQVKDGFRCLFMITYDDQDVEQKMDLLVYAGSTNLGAINQIYANFLYTRVFNEYNVTELEKNIPSPGKSAFDSTTTDSTYLNIKLGYQAKGQYLFVNVRSDSPDDIMMVASINSYEIESNTSYYYANARTEQIVQITEERMVVMFPIEAYLHVTIEDLDGEADVHWSDDNSIVHYLRGKGDRVTLTTSSSYKFLTLTNLLKNKNQPFVFMMNYYTRNPKINFDEVAYGSSIEIGYRNTDLPVFLFTKISDFTNDINLALTFRDSNIITEGEYKGSPIAVNAIFDTRNKIYSIKENPDFVPTDEHSLLGYYDPAIKTAQVFISDMTIHTFDIDPKDFPTLLLYVEKEEGFKDTVYANFTIESQFMRANSLVVPNQKVYNYGKFNGLINQYYRLKVDKDKTIMKIVLSFSSDLLAWCIGDPNCHSNATGIDMTTIEVRGKITITLKNLKNTEYYQNFIYLNIYKEDYMQDPYPYLQNYVFKYINVEDESKYFDYKIYENDGKIDYKDEKVDDKTRKITCTFNKIDIAPDNANITYFLKIVDDVFYLGEKMQTIALTQSSYYTKFKRNPEVINNQITLEATGEFNTWTIIQIIAQIQSNKVLEYVAYDGVYMKREKEEEKDDSDNTGLFIGISVALAILIIGLVAVVFYFQQKNKSLLNQVKHVSFQQQSTNNADPDLLLAKQQGS